MVGGDSHRGGRRQSPWWEETVTMVGGANHGGGRSEQIVCEAWAFNFLY